jgi:hypothetical protein
MLEIGVFMNADAHVSFGTAERYSRLFVNRLACTLQSSRSGSNGKYYYYRPKSGRRLSLATLREHLSGRITVGLYALNPTAQTSKWVAIDADYEQAFEDLLKLQWELAQFDIAAALEKSRRGGHLWIFGQQPLSARDCRVYIYDLARRLRLPIKGAGLAEGIEVFPRQDKLEPGQFGNAIRGPLGIHRATGKRYWFYGADYSIDHQLHYLEGLKKLTQAELSSLVDGLEMPPEYQPKPKVDLAPYDPTRKEFRILDHVQAKRKCGGNYWARCPSCAQLGHDRSSDNLAIAAHDPRKYKCWAGCTKEMIRAALGRPIRIRGLVQS